MTALPTQSEWEALMQEIDREIEAQRLVSEAAETHCVPHNNIQAAERLGSSYLPDRTAQRLMVLRTPDDTLDEYLEAWGL